MTCEDLHNSLISLKLPTMARNFAHYAIEAARSNKSHEEYLEELVEHEVRVREENARKNRLRLASFPNVKSLETYDFSAIPTLNKQLVLQLFEGGYLGDKENIIFLGGIGTGKTHLAIALGTQACQMGKKVKFCTVGGLINELLEAQREHKLSRIQQILSKTDLLVLDELGMVPFDKDGANLLFQVLAARYERSSTIITTNLEFKDWTQVFGSQQLTAAVLDRLTHRCHILEMNGDSYRFKESMRRKKGKGNSSSLKDEKDIES